MLSTDTKIATITRALIADTPTAKFSSLVTDLQSTLEGKYDFNGGSFKRQKKLSRMVSKLQVFFADLEELEGK